MIFSFNIMQLFFKKKIDINILIRFMESIGIEINEVIKTKKIFHEAKLNYKNNQYYIKLMNNAVFKNQFLLNLLKKNFLIDQEYKLLILKFNNYKIIDKNKTISEIFFNNDILINTEIISNLSYLNSHYNLSLYFNIFCKKFIFQIPFKQNFTNIIPVNNYININFINKEKLENIDFMIFFYIKIKNNNIVLRPLLICLGIKHVNFLVDLCSIFQIIYGFPIHCYKYFSNINISNYKKEIVVQSFKKKIICPSNFPLYSFNDKNNILCILGMTGVDKFGITNNENEFIIELAHFKSAYIKKLEKILHYKTLASFLFKNIFKKQKIFVDFFIDFCYSFIKYVKIESIPGLTFDSKNMQLYNIKHLNISKKNFDKYLGIKINQDIFVFIVKKIFRSIIIKENNIKVIVGFQQHIGNEQDCYEEILRFNDFAKIFNIQTKNNIILSCNTIIKDNYNQKYQQEIFKIKKKLVLLNFLEIITNSFVHSKKNNINNILLPDPFFKKKNFLRTKIYSNFLDYLSTIDLQSSIYDKFFEIGKIFFINNNIYYEQNHLMISFVIKNNINQEHIFFILNQVFDNLNFSFNNNNIFHNKDCIGNFFIKKNIIKNSFLNKKFLIIELNLDILIKQILKKEKKHILLLSKFNDFIDMNFIINDQNNIYKLNNMICKFFYKIIDFYKINNNIKLTIRFYCYKNNKVPMLLILKKIQFFFKKKI